MPVFNGAPYIRQSVYSILNQTHKDFEFIIVDDGSSDDTPGIVGSIKDSRIVYKRIEHSGTAAALNYGIKNSSGDWLARIDCDDLNVKTRLEQQIKYIGRNPECDVLSSRSIYFNNIGKLLFFWDVPENDEEIKKLLKLHNPLNQSSLFFRKDIILNNPFNENYIYYEDFELFYRLKDKLIFHNLPQYLTYTRVHEDSKSQNADNKVILNMLSSSSKYNDRDYKGWVNFFYGDKRTALKTLPCNSLKNITAKLSACLPDSFFKKLVQARLKFRIKSLFRSKKKYKTEIKNLLNAGK